MLVSGITVGYYNSKTVLMANEEHLKIIKQGVNAWNQWRERNPDIIPDLSKADLRGARFSKINLNRVILVGAEDVHVQLKLGDLHPL